ncbi:MAG: hypothetical protein PHY99_03645 [Bacteroidales bacterium]|nr:hypothetical protein [Bacteroidales bacterium]
MIGYGQESPDLKLIGTYFKQADSLCACDNGKLWGITLNGPIMLVNPENRLIIANRQDNAKQFAEKSGLFLGKLPVSINIANTSLDWSGEKWTMVMLNALPQDDPYSRNKLLIHESWHRMQDQIGIPAVTSFNTHLDDLKGIILLKLEFLALKNALISNPVPEKKKHLENALIIKKYRQLLFPGNNENAFERHEGMAEYTGPSYGFLFEQLNLACPDKIRQGKTL